MDPADRQQRAMLNHVIAGERSGAFKLPETMSRALEAENTLREQLAEARAELAKLRSTGAVIGDLVDDVVEAATSGQALPDVEGRVAQAEQAERAAQLRVQVFEQAVEQAGLAALYSTEPSTIVAECLRPALAEVLDGVRQVAPKLAGLDLSDSDQFLDAPEPTRKAFNRLRELSARYQAIRSAQAALNRGTADARGFLSEIRNLRELYGTRWQGHNQSSWTPWPQDELSRLVWLATSDAQPWCPTVAEQDQAYTDMLEASGQRGLTVAGRW